MIGQRPSRPEPVSFTVAIPVDNEDGGSYEVLYVNDGSRDGPPGVLGRLTLADPHVTVVEPSRNFGRPPCIVDSIRPARALGDARDGTADRG